MFRRFGNRRFVKSGSIIIFVLVFLSLGAYTLFYDTSKVKAASVIATSGDSTTTASTFQRKTFYDSTTSKYWAFYFDSSAGGTNLTGIKYANSSNGTTWNVLGTVATTVSVGTASSNFSAWLSSGGTVYIAYAIGASIYAQSGTLGSSSITWSGDTLAIQQAAIASLSITQDGNGFLWVIASVSHKTGPSTSQDAVYYSKSTSASSTSAWGTAAAIGAGGFNASVSVVAVPMTTAGNMMLLDLIGTSFQSFLYSGGVWASSGTTIASNTTGSGALNQDSVLSAVAGPSDTADLVYVDGSGGSDASGAVYYAHYSSGAWGTPVQLDSSTSDINPAISTDGSGNLYAYWMNGNTIYSKHGVSPYASGNWDASASTFYSTGTNANLSIPYSYVSGNTGLMWTSGSGSPYNIEFGLFGVSSGSAPNTPTLSAPSSGATGVANAPQFQLSTTDPDSDYVEYDIALYQSDCSTLVSDINQTSSETGWTGQNANGSLAYTSGSTATYNYPSALSSSTTYCWKARAIDPAGTNTWSSYSATQSFTTAANTAPAVPTLSVPANSAVGVSLTPQFQLSSTDANSDYIEYNIVLYQSDCSTQIANIDQTSSESGWTGQNANSGGAYSSGTTAIYNYTTSLTANTSYCWKARAKDPAGTNTWTSYSATRTFTTANPGSTDVLINGGTTIGGSTTIQ